MATLTTSFNLIINTNDAIWDDLILGIRSGEPHSLGETFPIRLSNGQVVDFMIVDIYGNDITFGAYPCLPDKTWFINPGNQYSQQGQPTKGWIESDLREYLNTTWFNMLPSSIKNAIKEKQSTYRTNIFLTERESASDKIWIPSVENLTDFSTGKLQPLSSAHKLGGPDRLLQYYYENETRKSGRFYGETNTDESVYFVTESYRVTNDSRDWGMTVRYYTQYNGVNMFNYTIYQAKVIPNFIISR